ncbi:MAG: 16S rRNA (uracil(1498)-N(3))-methyltransferase [Firmicutes bacterium]|nr:16S rRNA (uracil(1498)-N(3))-methyltransferase [Bacillota bacterium]
MSFWFFLPPEDLARQGEIVLQGQVIAHFKAARLRPGEQLVLADGRGRAFAARLLALSSRSATAQILHELQNNAEPPLKVTLFTGLAKGEKMDQIVRQSVELGVHKIVPVLTERTVIRLKGDKGEARAHRWQNVARSAAAQCRRSAIPLISKPLSFTEMLGLLHAEKLVLVPYEEEKDRGLGQLAANLAAPPRTAAVFTGPEGGISPREMEKLKGLPGFYPFTLGPRILRAETAPLAVLAVLMYLWGDWGP